MDENELTARAAVHLAQLCADVPHRAVGSVWNRQATEYFAGVVRSLGWQTRAPQFDCLDWQTGETRLRLGGESFTAYPSPFTLGCDVRAPLVAAGDLTELRQLDLTDKIVLLHDGLTRSQLAPKDYPFYTVEEHQEIISLLEARQPRAIIAATGRDLQMVGNLYPFPLFEDGNFNLPSCYITDVDGERLRAYAGWEIELSIEARRLPSHGCNVNALKGAPENRLVVCAHIDSKIGTPGANDNASGVVTLLLLAELLQDYAGVRGIELVAINGEDHYSAAGELLYLRENEGKMGEIALAINLDDVGYFEGKNACSFYNLPAEMEAKVRATFALHPDLTPGEPWYQSDHMVFVQNGVPALAITSDHFVEMMQTITHTPQDTLDKVDPARLARLALALRDVAVGWSV